MFCKHNWRKTDKTILPSAIQQCLEHNVKPPTQKTGEGRVMYAGTSITLVYIFQCTKCSKIKRLVTRP